MSGARLLAFPGTLIERPGAVVRTRANGTEERALAALDEGDRDAVLTLLMNAYGPDIYRYCCNLTRDSEAANDVLQSTFVSAYEGLGRFGRRSTFRTWLYGIARHRCLDKMRKRRRRTRRIVSVAELPDSPDPEEGSEAALEARDASQALEECLQRLAPRIRDAILLRFRDEFTYREMAALSRERAATLQARVSRAMPVLRRCLEERGVSP